MKYITTVPLTQFAHRTLDKIVYSIEGACGQMVGHHRTPTESEMTWALIQVDMEMIDRAVVSFRHEKVDKPEWGLKYGWSAQMEVEVPLFLAIKHTQVVKFLRYFERRVGVVSFFAFDRNAERWLRKVLKNGYGQTTTPPASSRGQWRRW